MNTKDLVSIAFYAAFISVCALITIPTPIVPFTLQTFAIALVAFTARKKHAVLAVMVYVVLGLLGLPVFAGGAGGLGIILSPTFGFIIGFIPMAYVVSAFKDVKVWGHRLPSLIMGMSVLYAIALPTLFFNVRVLLGLPTTLSTVILSYCLPYIPTDILSYWVASIISDRSLKVNQTTKENTRTVG